MIDVSGCGRIRVGRNKVAANRVHQHIQALEQAKKHAVPHPAETVVWLRHLPGDLRSRLVKLGLVLQAEAITVQGLIDRFERSQSVKPQTLRVQMNHLRSLAGFLGPGTPIKDIRRPDALEFRKWMSEKGRKNGEGLSPTTVTARLNVARALFRMAVQAKWVEANPFDKVGGGKNSNPKRAFFVSEAVASAVIQQLPTPETRLAFALARWGGLRMPSEPASLRWDGISWERMAMTFASPKTERHDGQESRTCPIFPQLVPYLNEAYDAAPDGAEWCCPFLREHNSVYPFRKLVVAAIARAGFQPWPRLFNNLRASRATEIHSEFGAKAESEWIGHGMDVALQNYVMVTDDTWNRAVRQAGEKSEKNPRPVKS